jgi:hypothetical protein
VASFRSWHELPLAYLAVHGGHEEQLTCSAWPEWLPESLLCALETSARPPLKLAKFLDLLSTILARSKSISHKTLERLLGKCVSLRIAVPGAMLFTRCGFAALRRFSASDSIPLDGDLRTELQHWTSLPSWHGTQSWRSECHVTLRIETDSSGRRWGGRIILQAAEYWARDDWTLAERTRHINILEMLAFYNVLVSFWQHLAGSHVDCYIDNQSAIFAFINGGGRNLQMTEVAKMVFELQLADNFEIQYHWIESAANSVADAISREESSLRLRPSIFMELDQLFAGFSYNLLSSAANT